MIYPVDSVIHPSNKWGLNCNNEPLIATGIELVSCLTCLHISLNLGETAVLACEMFTSGFSLRLKNEFSRLQGRFPFNKNHRFKFSEFSLVEWNASDRFPEFEVTYSPTQGMHGDSLLCMKMADFLNIFAALEQDDCETRSCPKQSEE